MATQEGGEEIKALLKSAKHCLKEKQYDEALKILIKILKTDPSNFTAYVYCGQAFFLLENNEKALKAFNKAVEINADNIKPWYMIYKIYASMPNPSSVYKELMVVYDNLLRLEENEEKWLDFVNQVDSHTCKKNDKDHFIKIFQGLLKSNSCFKKHKAAEFLSDFFMIDKNFSSPHLDIFGEAFSISIFNVNEDREKRYRKIPIYFQLIFKLKKIQSLMFACEDVLAVYDKLVVALEWICKGVIVSYLNDPSVNLEFKNASVTSYYDMLKESSTSALFLVYTAQAVEQIKLKEYVVARDDFLIAAVEMKSADWQSWYVLGKVHNILRCFYEAEHCIEQVYKRLNDTSSIKKTYNMDLELAKALCMQSSDVKKQQGLSLCLEILSESPERIEILLLALRVCVEIENWEVYEEQLANLKQIEGQANAILFIEALCYKKQGQYEEALKTIDTCLGEDADNPDAWHLRGDVLNLMEKYAEAMQAHLKVATLSPHWFEPFYILGRYYQNFKFDLNTAKRCFLKAFQLNPRSDDVGIALSDVYRSLKLADENVKLLETVTIFGAKWAKLRLGLQFIESGDYQKAINHLRSAARSDPNDSHCWEALGDGYLKRGAFSAAKKCYTKVVQLQPNTIYAKLQIAQIYQILGLAEESLEEYRTILLFYPECMPAMKGVAESCLILVRKRLEYSGNLVQESHDLCQHGVDTIVRGLLLNNRISCLWKTLGDILVTVCKLPKQYQTINLPSGLVDNSEEGKVYSMASFNEILPIALNAYRKALLLSKSFNVEESLKSRIIYSIAYCLNLEATLSESGEKRKHALKCAKQCVRMQPKSYSNWNLLGVIAASDELQMYALAQHAFIKSIKVERVNPSAWTNLGTLYLKLNCINLANDCFKEAQTIDPAYIMAWLGQATVAESIDHSETMKMLHHTCTLGEHHNAITSFSYEVLKSLQVANTSAQDSLNKLYSEKNTGLPLALVQISSCYVKEDLDQGCISNLKGCLSSWNKDFKNAVSHYTKALDCCSEEDQTQIRLNLIFALIGDHQYEAAIEQFPHLKDQAFPFLCAQGFCYFKAKEFEQSYKSYEQASEMCTSDNTLMKAELQYVMAANSFSAGDYECSRLILFQSLQIRKNFTRSLFALCALGILKGDLELAKTTFNELAIQESAAGASIANYVDPGVLMMLKCYIAFIEENLNDIECYINTRAAKLKSSSRLVVAITKLLQQLSVHTKNSGYSKIALRLAYSATHINVELAVLICYLHLSLNQTKTATSQLGLFLNMFPSDLQLKFLLMVAHSRQNLTVPSDYLVHVDMASAELTPSLEQWFEQMNLRETGSV